MARTRCPAAAAVPVLVLVCLATCWHQISGEAADVMQCPVIESAVTLLPASVHTYRLQSTEHLMVVHGMMAA